MTRSTLLRACRLLRQIGVGPADTRWLLEVGYFDGLVLTDAGRATGGHE